MDLAVADARSSPQESRLPFDARLLARLRAIAWRGLARMYRPEQQMFAFCVRRGPAGDALEGVSRRYTAMALLGLANEPEFVAAEILAGKRRVEVCERLLNDVATVENLGDVALTLWVARVLALPVADRKKAYERLCELGALDRAHATVEFAWALDALTRNDDLEGASDVRDAVAQRLLSAWDVRSGLFRHIVGGRSTLRGHVGCFADIVYPVHALSNYIRAASDSGALAVAERCARRACELQGAAGQWWWHYDTRTGQVIEGYPVYSVHQDAMAPMALFALKGAGGTDHSAAVRRGLDWLAHSPELDGGSLLDDDAGLVWRKVARREPRKLTRRLQAAASAVHPALRLPGVDTLFPPVAVDWESRPYHLGWILYAWSPARMEQWGYPEVSL